jgi:hypothetical protein
MKLPTNTKFHHNLNKDLGVERREEDTHMQKAFCACKIFITFVEHYADIIPRSYAGKSNHSVTNIRPSIQISEAFNLFIEFQNVERINKIIIQDAGVNSKTNQLMLRTLLESSTIPFETSIALSHIPL